MIRFDVSALIKARLGKTLTLNLDTGPQTLKDLEVSFLRGSVQATRVQSGLLIQGAVASQLRLECVRCLEPFNFPLVLELEEIFRLSPTKAHLPYYVGEDGWIDLAPLLREQAWVEIPMKPLCRPDCKGLCPHCGANLNIEPCTCKQSRIDPRLAPLQKLME